MATAKQIAWRKKFAARYGKGKKGPKKTRSPKKGSTMARRRSYTKKVGRRIGRRASSFRRSRAGVIPLVDTLHGIYTLDGMSDGRVHQAGENFIGAVAGQSGMSFDNGIAHLNKGAQYALQNPSKAVIGGMKNFATVYVARKVLGIFGVPKTIKVLNKRIQVR